MKHRINLFTIFFSGLVVMWNAQAHADDSLDTSLSLQVGLATWASTSFYRDVDDKYYLFPVVLAEYGRCYLEVTNVGCQVFQGGNGQRLAIELNRTFDGFKSRDSSFLSGMAERKSAWEAGLVYEISLGGGQLNGKLMSDISNSHEGYSTRWDYEHLFWQDNRHMMNWFVGAEYWDRSKTDYYFGVKSNEEQLGRAAYSALDSHSLFVGGNAFKQLSREVTLFFSAEYRSVSEAVADSPLVSRDDQWSSYAGFFYKF